MTSQDFVGKMKTWLVALQINDGQRLLNYGDYMRLPKQSRSGDEAAVVDAQITAQLLGLLGFDASRGEVVYNRKVQQSRRHVPDFVLGIATAGGSVYRLFPVEDKSSALTFDELVGNFTGQLADYMRALSQNVGILTNGRYVIGFGIDDRGALEPLVSVDLLDIYDSAMGVQLPLGRANETPLVSLWLRFGADSYKGQAHQLRFIGRSFAGWLATARPVDAHVDEFIGELNEQIDLLRMDAEAQLRAHLLAAEAAEAAIGAAMATALGGGVDPAEHVRLVLSALARDIAKLSPAEQLALKPPLDAVSMDVANVASLQAVDDAWATVSPTVSPALKSAIDVNIRELLRSGRALAQRRRDVQLSFEKPLAVAMRYRNWFELLRPVLLIDEEKGLAEFALQAAFVFVVRLLLIRICEDKELLKRRALSSSGFRRLLLVLRRYLSYSKGTGYGGLLDVAYENAQHIYAHFFDDQRLFDWYTASDRAFLDVLSFLNRFSFKAVSHDVLGIVYERYAKLHTHEREGRYYTKGPIVDCMLEIAGVREGKLAGKRLLDPACGSGTFLVRAVRKWIAQLSKAALTTEEVIEECMESVWGLDVNPFACYLAETNLLIQFLDLIIAARSQGRVHGIKRFHIYNTDSLMSPSRTLLLGSTSDPDVRVVDAIKSRSKIWDYDFSAGWDFIVANPPYKDRAGGLSAFPSAKNNENLYTAFMDLAYRLARVGGTICYITPTSWLTQPKYLSTRRELFSRLQLEAVVKCPYDMFEAAYVDTAIFCGVAKPFSAGRYSGPVQCAQAPKRADHRWLDPSTIPFSRIDSARWLADDQLRIILREVPLELLELARRNQWQPLSTLLSTGLSRGILPPDPGLLKPLPDPIHSERYFATWKPVHGVSPGAVRRYTERYPGSWLFLKYRRDCIGEYRDPSIFRGERVLLRRAASRQYRLQAVFENRVDFVNTKDLYILVPDRSVPGYALLAIVNSRLASFQIVNYSDAAQKDDFGQISQGDVEDLLFPSIPPVVRNAIARSARQLQRGGAVIDGLGDEAVSVDRDVDGVGSWLATARIVQRPDLVRGIMRHAAVMAESNGDLVVGGNRTLAATSYRVHPGTRTITLRRGRYTASISCGDRALFVYFVRVFAAVWKSGQTLDGYMRSLRVPVAVADCGRALRVLKAKKRRLKSLLRGMIRADRDIDSRIEAAGVLTPNIKAALADAFS